MEIRFDHLSKIYSGGVKALDNITLTIPVGMYGLLGPNGAGKTTLMRILCTLIEPTSGQITVAGVNRLEAPQRIREMIGYLPQEFGLYRKLTAYEYLDFAAGMKGLHAADRQRQVPLLLEKVNLAHERKKPVGGFSGGMKRRLGIAQALLGDPQILVVDEPTAGLDPEERLHFRNLLTELSGNRIILLSTHIVADIESTCSALAVLHKGRLHYHGSPAELVHLAEGRVWDVEIPAGDYDRLRPLLKIVSTRRTASGIALRVLAEGNPLDLGQPLPPTLEDGYLCLMEEVGK